mgnify:CR=1 FL=1
MQLGLVKRVAFAVSQIGQVAVADQFVAVLVVVAYRTLARLTSERVGAGGALTAAAAAGPYTLTGSHFPLVPPDGASLLVGTWGTPGALMQYAIGAGGAPDHASSDAMMHATATVDYIIVLKGEIWAILDKGEKLLKQGDVLIQRGTNHSWSVRTREPAIVAAVLVSARPTGRLTRRKSKATAKRGKKR